MRYISWLGMMRLPQSRRSQRGAGVSDQPLDKQELSPCTRPDAFFAALDDNVNRRRHHDVWELAELLHIESLLLAMTPGKLEKVERERLEALDRYEIRTSAKKKTGLWDRDKEAGKDRGVAPSLNRKRIVAEGSQAVRVSPDGTLLAVLDVIAIVTGNRHPRKVWERVCAAHPEVDRECRTVANRRGRPSIYAPPEHVLYVLSKLPGKKASEFFATFLKIALRQTSIKLTVTPSGVTVGCGKMPTGPY